MASTITPKVAFLIAMMLLTGVCNTLLTKFQDKQCVRDCDTKHPKTFEQPVIQTVQMFIGEMGCWLVIGGSFLYKRHKARSGAKYQPIDSAEEPHTPLAGDEAVLADTPVDELPLKLHRPFKGKAVFLLAAPACCDIAGTTLMNVGLLFVAASIYQMTRGLVILFTGILSVVFLKRHLTRYKWSMLFVVFFGVLLVGLAGALDKDEKTVDATSTFGGAQGELKAAFMVGRNIGAGLLKRAKDELATSDAAPLAWQAIIGVLLIGFGQVFTASQFVIEEKIMEIYDVEPLHMVGWEGIFGFTVTVIVMIVMHLAVGRTPKGQYGYFDAREGLYEMFHHPTIAVTSLAIMVSIGGFNFFGLSITRTVSATTRSLIDTCRTLFIWLVSLGLRWETFKWLQVPGFILLVTGTMLYEEIIKPEKWFSRTTTTDELLPEHPVEHN